MRGRTLAGSVTLLFTGLCGGVLAADPASAVAPPPELGIGTFFQKGGFMMYPLLAMSILALALVIYFFIVLRRGQVVPELLRKDVLEKIRRNALEDARAACSYKPCAFAEVTLVALEFVLGSKTRDANLLKDIVVGEGSRQASTLQGQIQYLFDIAVLSPMVGLVGTVFGMIHAFHTVAQDLVKAKPELLANGVSEALVATATGLLVGIPAMAFFAYFRGRVNDLIGRLETASTEVVTTLLRDQP